MVYCARGALNGILCKHMGVFRIYECVLRLRVYIIYPLCVDYIE